MVPLNNSSRFEVSIARRSDRPLIIRLCRRAVGRSDYVLRILPTLIVRGGLFLAWDEDALVGVTNFERCIDGSGWLSAARTDPDWRRRGVAIFLQRKIAAYAKRRRVGTLRLLVSSQNRPSLRTCEKGGFKRVCETARISCNLRTKRPRAKASPSSYSQTQLQSLLKSRYLAKTRGYIGYRRHFLKLTTGLLKQLRDQGELYSTGDSTLLITRPQRTFRELHSSLTILGGPIAKSLKEAKGIAQGMGARILSSHIPYNAYEISVAKRLGFRSRPWGKHSVVFEKKI